MGMYRRRCRRRHRGGHRTRATRWWELRRGWRCCGLGRGAFRRVGSCRHRRGARKELVQTCLLRRPLRCRDLLHAPWEYRHRPPTSSSSTHRRKRKKRRRTTNPSLPASLGNPSLSSNVPFLRRPSHLDHTTAPRLSRRTPHRRARRPLLLEPTTRSLPRHPGLPTSRLFHRHPRTADPLRPIIIANIPVLAVPTRTFKAFLPNGERSRPTRATIVHHLLEGLTHTFRASQTHRLSRETFLQAPLRRCFLEHSPTLRKRLRRTLATGHLLRLNIPRQQ